MNLKAKDKKQKRRVSLEERRENVMAAMRKWEMLAAAKVKIIGSEKKYANKNTCDISPVKLVARKFHVVVYQNNGKEMYKRVYCTCKVFFIFY